MFTLHPVVPNALSGSLPIRLHLASARPVVLGVILMLLGNQHVALVLSGRLLTPLASRRVRLVNLAIMEI